MSEYFWVWCVRMHTFKNYLFERETAQAGGGAEGGGEMPGNTF